MMRVRLALVAALAVAIGSLIPIHEPLPAYANGKICAHHHKIIDGTGQVTVQCDKWVSTGKKPRTTIHSDNTSAAPTKPQPTYAQRVAAIRKKNEQARQAYIDAVKQANDHYKTGECVFVAGGSFTGKDCNPTPPKMITIPPRPKDTPAPAQPPVPPEEAAYLAIATKLRINPSGVGIGPDPALSRWKMAVVGHSYWLWATGPTHLGPVTASSAGLTVTLEANLTSVTFDMGDGHAVTCNGPGTPYPGDKDGLYAKSPTCGYAYQTTSEHQPGDSYPVRATTYWSVAYTTPDGSGTIPIILATVRNLKVGELQTVITH